MNDDLAFLNAIREEPDNVELRLVYADWLEEQGDPRGEFLHIRWQLATRPPGTPEDPALRKREQELIWDCLAEWFAIPKVPVWTLLGGKQWPPIPEWLVARNISSWHVVVTDFANPYWGPDVQPLGQLVQEIASAETGKLFRAGRDCTSLLISTDENDGFKPGDRNISISFNKHDELFQVWYRDQAPCCSEKAMLPRLGAVLADLWTNTRGRQYEQRS